jgi:uncharacterized protein
MASQKSLLSGYPALSKVVRQLDKFLEERHPTTFGPRAVHPVLHAKRSKVIHDNLWGTVKFSWRELVLIDSPLMQRLRDLHQTGLAFHVYPSARHSRFEHSLGAAAIASRIFDALTQRQRGDLRDIAKILAPNADPDLFILRLKQELRLAALLHDTGHSLFSHTSERVYGDLDILSKASKELTALAGKKKGAGEVLSFCVALAPSIQKLLDRTQNRLLQDGTYDDYVGEIDMKNVGLIIIGRSSHPYLQFLGDIVSSGFDADKLDYLLRDAKAAGLPLRYDIDRYLYDVRMEKEVLADGEGQLEKLYGRFNRLMLSRFGATSSVKHPYYETYRLRLSKRAMNVIEQIVICKMMLYSYIYHHAKVRASEGVLERLLRRNVSNWKANGESDRQCLVRFLDMTDASLREMETNNSSDLVAKEYCYRLLNRLIPREVYSISGPSTSHAPGAAIREFLLKLHERGGGKEIISELEAAIGEELLKLAPGIAGTTGEALAKAGVWVDAPTPPKFEDVDTMVGSGRRTQSGVPIAQVFPVRQWTEAYEHYRYQVRIFAFSEYWELTKTAAKAAMIRVLGISGDTFYESIKHERA